MNKSDTIAIIRALLSSTNSSYTTCKLMKDFKNETGIDIPLFGYGNISDFLNSIPDTVKVTGVYPAQHISLVNNEKSAHIVSLVKRQRKNDQKNKFFFNNNALSTGIGVYTRFETEELEESSEILEKEASDELKGKTCPSSSKKFAPLKTFLLTLEGIPPINVKLHTQVGKYIEVCPCWIYSPDKFYFHFRKFKRKFGDFIKNFQTFYTVHEEIPNMVGDAVKPRQPCAVFYKMFSEAMWHRAEIWEINKNSQVVVNFVDYGNSAEISKEKIKYLHHDFQSFPRQAVLGSLANIRPLKGLSKWSSESIKRFYDLAFEKDLVGGVVNMDEESGCVGMALSKTSGSEIHINDALVKEGYAEFNINVLSCGYRNVPNKVNLFKSEVKSSVRENIQSPEFFFTNDYCNNAKLKKMFSLFEEK